MKRIITLVLAVLLLSALCACASGAKITFKNEHLTTVHSIYITVTDAMDWGEPVNGYVVEKDKSTTIRFSKFSSEEAENDHTEAVEYDVAVLENSDILYTFYTVPLRDGDTLAFSGVGLFGTLKVTGADGSTETYKGEGEKVETTTR